MNLKEWTSIYLDHINSFKKNIEKKEVFKDRIVCHLKNGDKQIYQIRPKLNIDILKKNQNRIIIVCLNTKDNLNFVIENWSRLIKNPLLKIIFTNTFENQQWSLIPFLHNKISEKATLKRGLKSLFESVPEVTKAF